MKFTRLPRGKRLKLVHYFIEDIGASSAARLLALNRKTVNSWYTELRRRLSLLEGTLTPIKDRRVFAGYHERRIASRNGLFASAKGMHLLESRVRFQLKGKLKATVLAVSKDLID